ncbi:MAG TPA: class 1 fructose-bisphosphatase [Candidatus Binatia bacterium]|nr:class 1 fructose-bisphosphatase [Candidatus Binatia bacterium]
MELIGESLRVHLLGVAGNLCIDQGVANVLLDLATVAKTISCEVNRAGLVGILGMTAQRNVHGEEVQKLDVYANELIIESLRGSGSVCGMGSEENEGIIAPSRSGQNAEYLCLFDPLDGSSNIDVNVSIGTIFSIFRRKSNGGPAVMSDFLQHGRDQVAAGYFVYGTSTMLVYTCGDGVNGFTLEPSTGEFRLSHPRLMTPSRGSIYSCNEGNSQTWDPGTRAYIESLKATDKEAGRPYKSRYVGSFVADFHRNLLKGGIFLYPADRKDPSKPAEGKLRLMYECNPMAFIQEQAGGRALDGDLTRVLDITPNGIHHKIPLVIGSSADIEEYSEYYVRHATRGAA